MARDSNYGRFLTLLQILVDETSKDRKLTKRQLLTMFYEQTHTFLHEDTFDRYISNMSEGGITIKREREKDKPRGAFLYWYAKGWI